MFGSLFLKSKKPGMLTEVCRLFISTVFEELTDSPRVSSQCLIQELPLLVFFPSMFCLVSISSPANYSQPSISSPHTHISSYPSLTALSHVISANTNKIQWKQVSLHRDRSTEKQDPAGGGCVCMLVCGGRVGSPCQFLSVSGEKLWIKLIASLKPPTKLFVFIQCFISSHLGSSYRQITASSWILILLSWSKISRTIESDR